MSVLALTGSDVVKINDRILSNLADDDCVLLEYPNQLANVKTGKNGNSLFGWNATGLNVKMTLRVIKASGDDKYLNSLLASLNADAPAFSLLSGQFVKRVGDGATNISKEQYDVSGGIFTKMPGSKENVSGDTNQAVTVYEVLFSNSPRAIM
jgi:hypothetical protein